MRIIKTSNYKTSQQNRFVRIIPSNEGENLYDISVSSYKNRNLGGQVLKGDLTLEEAERQASEWAQRWGYELIKEDLSTRSNYDRWLKNKNTNIPVNNMGF